MSAYVTTAAVTAPVRSAMGAALMLNVRREPSGYPISMMSFSTVSPDIARGSGQSFAPRSEPSGR